MLESIRKHAQGWFAWTIIILISVPFALWGIHQYFEGDSSVNVAVVNDKKISDREYQQAYQQQRNRIQTMLGKNFDPSLIDEKQLKKNVLENLIEREVMIQGARDAGLRVSDARIGTEIRAIPNLQNKGQFDKEQYERLLRSQGLSVGAFENMVGNDLVIQQLNQGIADSVIVTKPELDALLRIKLQQRDIGYALVPVSSYVSDATVEDRAIEKFYKDNPDRFRTPEQVSIDYIELAVDDLAKDIQTTEAALHERYQERAAGFTTPEERRVRHILIKVASNAPPAAVDAAKKKAEELLARIRKGESFAEQAKLSSEDPGSAKDGGDLGFFGRGVMDKEFEQSVYSLKVGEVSEPVRSTFGIHLIKLEAVRGGERKPFEQVRAELEADVKHQQAEDKFFAAAESLSNMAFEHADNLTDAAHELHLPIKNSPLFTRGGGVGITANPKIREAAFSDDVLLGGKNSAAIELTQDHVVVIHLKEHRLASLRPLNEVRMDIHQVLRMEAAKNKAKKVGEEVVKRLKAGEDPVSVMTQMKLKWERIGFLGRQDTKVDRQIIEGAFHQDRSLDEHKPIFDGKAMSSGDFAVYGVYAVKDGDPSGADQKDVDSLKDSLDRERGQMTLKEYVDALKGTMKITRYEDKL